ncbi:MAG: dCTP deaminase [Candidatus Pacebacteria bacterium]|nr:dCTP deaminase [Candidatus Paceibacterota bacterium]
MYLADRELKSLIPQLNIVVEAVDIPFNIDTQLQPASIDLRLGKVFWKPTSKSRICLREANRLNISPDKAWKKIEAREGETIILKPGQMLLARTLERFSIPNQYAGKIEGRSSFSRIGLSIHCSGDFINPGYVGNMTLQLYNSGIAPIELVPSLPICQLIIIQLSSTPETAYGSSQLSSNYVNDDGGPSYWWRDKRIMQLHELLERNNSPLRIKNELLTIIGSNDPELIKRITRFISKLKLVEVESTEKILKAFSTKEEKSRILNQIFLKAFGFATISFATLAIDKVFTPPYGSIHYLIWIMLALFSVGYYSLQKNQRGTRYFGKSEFEWFIRGSQK